MKGKDDQAELKGEITPVTSAGSVCPPRLSYVPMSPQFGPPCPSSSYIDQSDFSDDQPITPTTPVCSSAVATGESCLTLSAKVGLSPIVISSSAAGLREIPCMVTLTGVSRSIDEIERERTGTDLVCVIDVSGSMTGGKLEMAKHSLSFIVDNLCAKDRIALVVFDDMARRLCPLTVCDDAGRVSIQHIISTIHTNGSTNIEFGLRLGLKVLLDRRVVNNLSALFLMSDGRDTCGNDPLARCRQTLSAGQRQGGGVLVHTFGFGNDHDSVLMSALAEEGGGGFQYVEQVEEIAGAFATSFGGVVSIVAREVEVRVTVNAGEDPPCVVSRLYVRTGLDYFSLPFITANEHKDLVFLLALPSPALSSPLTVSPVSIQLTYKDVAGMQQRQETKLTLSLCPAGEGNLENIEEGVYINWYRVKGAEALSVAKELANSGRLDEAREGLSKILAEMNAAVVQTAPLVMQMMTDIEESLRRLTDMQSYHNGGSAHMSSLSSNHYYQYSSPSTQVYSTIQQSTYTVRSSNTLPVVSSTVLTAPPVAISATQPQSQIPLPTPPRFAPPQFVAPWMPSMPSPGFMEPPNVSPVKYGIPAGPLPTGIQKFGPPRPMGIPKFGTPTESSPVLPPQFGLPAGPPPMGIPKFGPPAESPPMGIPKFGPPTGPPPVLPPKFGPLAESPPVLPPKFGPSPASSEPLAGSSPTIPQPPGDSTSPEE